MRRPAVLAFTYLGFVSLGFAQNILYVFLMLMPATMDRTSRTSLDTITQFLLVLCEAVCVTSASFSESNSWKLSWSVRLCISLPVVSAIMEAVSGIEQFTGALLMPTDADVNYTGRRSQPSSAA